MPLLQHHIAVITGAGSGIGQAIAAGYAREGAHVVALDIDASAAAETAKQIKTAGGKAKAGASCKVNADCDQSERPQHCRENKCELTPPPVHPVT